MTSTKTKPAAGKRKLPWILEVYRTDVGKKYAMAITGVLGLAFIIAHMVGNLHVFEGEHQINEYGEALRDLGEPLLPRTLLLWAFLRIPMIIALGIHLHAAWSLSLSNRRARGTEAYDSRNYIAATYASRTMRWGGIIILLYLVFHLADLTWGFANPDFIRGDIYHNLGVSLRRPIVWIAYVAAQGALALHIWHGSWSLFQSLGLNNPRFNRFRRTFASGLTTIIVAGYLVVPVAIAVNLIS